MAAEQVFLDTVALLALANADDELHVKSKQVLQQLAESGCSFVTTDWVLCEFLGGAARQPLRAAAIRMVQRLRASDRMSILPATREDWTNAFALFTKRTDKEWSLADCSSILVCEQLGIRRVFTRDRHFAQAGLQVLLS